MGPDKCYIQGRGTDLRTVEVYLEMYRFFFATLLYLGSVSSVGADCEDVTDRFCVSFYNNSALAGEPVWVGSADRVSHFWKGAAPLDGVSKDHFSAKWRGWFQFEAGIYRFSALADDGVRVLVNGKPIIEAWVYQAATLHTGDLELGEGRHLVEIEYFEATGQATLDVDWALISSNEVCEPPENRFCAAYYANTDLAGAPFLVTQEDVVDHQWAGRGPAEEGPSDLFSARWRGQFHFEAGYHTFRVIGDDGVRLYVDNQLIINGWRNQAATEYEASMPLEAGSHLVRLEYYERTGQARIKLDWELDSSVNLANAQSPLGANISALNYYATEWTLMNAMKASGGWLTQNRNSWNTEEQALLDLDEHGEVRFLPAEDSKDAAYRWVGALMFNGAEGHYPAGQYTVLYDGEGELDYGLDAVFNKELSRPGRHVLDVLEPSNGGFVLRIKATNPQNHVRNIRVIMPGFSCDENPFHYCDGAECTEDAACVSLEALSEKRYFHPKFLNDLREYGVIRFMDFLRTNTTTVANWEDRPKMEDVRWNSTNGAPIELAIELANRLNADAWLNIPVQATDDYVVNFAQLVLDELNPGLKVYVEYGNEIWNTVFSAGSWVEEQAEARWPDARTSGFTKRMNWQGMRSAEVIGLWKEVWGDQANRIKGVLSGQASNVWVSEQALACPLWVGEGHAPCAENVDVLAIAPYFGGYLGREQFQHSLNAWIARSENPLDSVFQELRQGGLLFNPNQLAVWNRSPEHGALSQAFAWVDDHKRVAGAHGLELAAYEAGQHLAGVGAVQNDAAITDLFVEANRDPRMGELYEAYLAGWKARGGALMCHFLSVGAYGRYGSWGSKEHQTQDHAPKYMALKSFIEANPCWWQGCGIGERTLTGHEAENQD